MREFKLIWSLIFHCVISTPAIGKWSLISDISWQDISREWTLGCSLFQVKLAKFNLCMKKVLFIIYASNFKIILPYFYLMYTLKSKKKKEK